MNKKYQKCEAFGFILHKSIGVELSQGSSLNPVLSDSCLKVLPQRRYRADPEIQSLNLDLNDFQRASLSCGTELPEEISVTAEAQHIITELCRK